MSLHDAYVLGIRELMEREPGWPSMVAKYRDWLPDWAALCDVVEQRHWADKSDGGYAADITTVRLAYRRVSREVLTARLPVGSTPSPNERASENNEILSSLQRPFTAEFYGVNEGPGYNDDGFLEWSEPLVIEGITIPPGRVPLEVGTTRCSTTELHLKTWGVARWPYGFNEVWLLIKRQPGWMSTSDQRALL